MYWGLLSGMVTVLIYAIPFELNGEKVYYDRAGKSLEGPLKAPLDFSGFLPVSRTAVSTLC